MSVRKTTVLCCVCLLLAVGVPLRRVQPAA